MRRKIQKFFWGNGIKIQEKSTKKTPEKMRDGTRVKTKMQRIGNRKKKGEKTFFQVVLQKCILKHNHIDFKRKIPTEKVTKA